VKVGGGMDGISREGAALIHRSSGVCRCAHYAGFGVAEGTFPLDGGAEQGAVNAKM